MDNKRTSGFWILIIIGVVLNLIYLLGQTMAMINYDFTVSIGLQEPVSEITGVGVAFNKGFGFGDTFFYMPLFVIGIVGLIKRKTYGLFSMVGAMAITIYWPMVSLSAIYFAKGLGDFHFTDYVSYSILLSLIAIYGLWGMGYVYNNRKMLVK